MRRNSSLEIIRERYREQLRERVRGPSFLRKAIFGLVGDQITGFEKNALPDLLDRDQMHVQDRRHCVAKLFPKLAISLQHVKTSQCGDVVGIQFAQTPLANESSFRTAPDGGIRLGGS